MQQLFITADGTQSCAYCRATLAAGEPLINLDDGLFHPVCHYLRRIHEPAEKPDLNDSEGVVASLSSHALDLVSGRSSAFAAKVMGDPDWHEGMAELYALVGEKADLDTSIKPLARKIWKRLNAIAAAYP